MVNVGELRDQLAHFDPEMEIRLVGSGTLEASYLAISHEAKGTNLLLLSAFEIDRER